MDSKIGSSTINAQTTRFSKIPQHNVPKETNEKIRQKAFMEFEFVTNNHLRFVVLTSLKVWLYNKEKKTFKFWINFKQKIEIL